MNDLQIFNSTEFGEVRTIVIDNEVWFVGKDVCDILKYQNGSRDINRHVDEEDRIKEMIAQYQNGTLVKTQTILINESGLFSLALSSKLPKAKEFKRWITIEVIPSIRKHGGYLTPAKIEEVLSNPDTIIKLATELKKLRTENQMQAQQIAEFKPIKEYVDLILQSDGTVTTTQIAADYGLSAKKLNKILNEEKIQHKVNDQWILYSNMMNKGYTKSETIDIERSDGRIETKMHTRWTQKGRLKIHEILTNLGFIANYDREQQKYYEKYLRECGMEIEDELKRNAMKYLFVSSQVMLIYGAAGTGKTTLIKYISEMMRQSKKLF